jgi:nicotinamide-nucleotide amidase
MLGVSPDILETLGAVSEATAWAMARGALDRSRADIAVAVSGIAGPGGGSDRKPVGTVVFASAIRNGADQPLVADTHQFGDLGRSEIRRQAALVALRLLLP